MVFVVRVTRSVEKMGKEGSKRLHYRVRYNWEIAYALSNLRLLIWSGLRISSSMILYMTRFTLAPFVNLRELFS